MSNQEKEPIPAPVLLNKDLIKQFDKVLSVSCQKADPKKGGSSLTGVSSSSGSVQRRRRSRKKKKVLVLRPSRLKVDSAINASSSMPPSNHFSFEKCSKELESIMAPSSSSISQQQSALRPRSASLPSQPQSKSEVPTKNNRQTTTTTVKKTLVTTAKAAAKPITTTTKYQRVVKKRKHLSTAEEAKTGEGGAERKTSTCAQQARQDLSQDIDRLADYLEESILLPKKMSYMAEMMYT